MAKQLIATLVTNSNGEAFYTYTGTGAGETTFTAESGDLESEPLIINDVPEKITLTADKNILSYADNDTVTLTATYEGTTLEGKSVVFKLGNRVLDTVLTDSEGVAEYEYSSQGMGNIVFSAECGELQETISIEDCIKYDGNIYSENHDYNLQLPSTYSLEFDIIKKGTSYGSTGGMVLGTSSNYFMVGSGSSANLYVSRWGTNISFENLFTLTQNEWKSIVLEVNGSNVTIKADGNTYSVTGVSNTALYQISCGNSNVNVKNLKIKSLPFNGSMSVSASKDILSYADEDECVLTATLTGDNVDNRPVIFKNGSTVLDTVNTDSNGIATYNYESQGVGDVTITVECMNLQETYELEDCYFYDTLTTDKQLFSIATGSGTLTYSNDGLTFRDSTSSETKVLFDKQLPTSDYEVSYDIVAYGNTNNKPQVCFEDFFLGINNNGYYGRRVSASGNLWGESGSPTPPHTIRHKITGTSSKTVETYQNSTLLGTSTSINQTRVMQIFAYENGRSITFTNLKIKPL